MNSIASWSGATVFAINLVFYPHAGQAEEFTGKEFAEWSETSQDSYIQTSVTMAGVIFSQTRPTIARCVNDWYYKDNSSDTRNSTIRSAISENATFHPSAVILAIIVKECGSIK